MGVWLFAIEGLDTHVYLCDIWIVTMGQVLNCN